MKNNRILSFIILFAMALSFMAVGVAAEEEVVREIFMDENVNSSFASWSNPLAESTTEKVKEGTAAVKVPFKANDGWNMCYWYLDNFTLDEEFLANNAIQFWYYCDTEIAANNLRVVFQVKGIDGATSYIRYSFEYSGSDVGTWKLITIPLANWKAERQNQTTWTWETSPEATPDFTQGIESLNFQASTGNIDPVEPSYFDSVRFIKANGTATTPDPEPTTTPDPKPATTPDPEPTVGGNDTPASPATSDLAVIALAASALSAAALVIFKKRR